VRRSDEFVAPGKFVPENFHWYARAEPEAVTEKFTLLPGKVV
jgi:hypothetical protein